MFFQHSTGIRSRPSDLNIKIKLELTSVFTLTSSSCTQWEKKKRAEHPDKLKRMQLEYSAGKMRAQLNEEALLCRNVTILSYKRALGTLLPVKLVGLSEPFYVD